MVEGRDRWAKTLAEICVESLGRSSEASNDDKVVSYEEKVLKLYITLNSEVTEKRLAGKSIRGWMKDKDTLVKDIYARAEYSADRLDDYFKDIGVHLTVTLVGVIAARLDENFRYMKMMIDWCNECLPTGYTTNKFMILKAADYYCQFGEYRYMNISNYSSDQLPQLPDPRDLDEFLEDVKKMSDSYHYRVHLFLVEAVAQLPPYLLRENNIYPDWLDKIKESDESKQSRFLYNLSRAAYALGNHEEAIRYAIDALQSANANDIGFIDRCRTHLLVLEQELAATETIVAESIKKAEIILNDKIEKATSDVMSEVEKQVSEFQEQVRDEIKSTLLIVIEILGLFLAVSGAVVAAVGGIGASDSILQSFVIYATSGVTIVALFWMLRALVLKPLRREKQVENTTN